MERIAAAVLLKKMLGPEAEFRDGQWEAIDLVANRRQRVLVVQRTGWGKSVVYFLATKILRDAGAGPTLLVSPLLSLMRNQILAAEKLGIRAVTVHSENVDEWPEVEAALKKNRCDVLLVAPERLGNPDFMRSLLPFFQRQMTRRAVPASLVQDAVDFLRGDALVLEARDRWPRPVLKEVQAAFPDAVALSDKGVPKTVIPEERHLQLGRVLCIWGDAGWGPEVARGKYETGTFSDALVGAAAKLVREKWKPEPFPEWIAAVPSLHRPELVQDFAERLAAKLGVPFVPVLRKVRDTPPQKEMQNSVRQVRNLLGAFAVSGTVPGGPVLLVDDVTDSRWTLTLIAVILRQRTGRWRQAA